MFELATDVGVSVLEAVVSSLSLYEFYKEFDLSSDTRSRLLSLHIDTDVENLTYEINLNFKSKPKMGEAMK